MALSSKQIKKALRARELNMAVIARRLNVSPTTVWKNVHKVKGGKSTKVRQEIANALGMGVKEVFGEAA